MKFLHGKKIQFAHILPFILICCTVIYFTACSNSNSSTPTSSTASLSSIQHVVVLYMENHSFDNLYGEFPGANGLNYSPSGMTGMQYAAAHQQVDTTGGKNTVFQFLPRPVNTEVTPNVPDSLFPATLANAPFPLESYVGTNEDIPDLIHRYYQEQMEIDGGKMDMYASVEDAKGLTMGYWHTMELPLVKYAMQYTLCDNFFHSAFGGSFLNHQVLVSAQTPSWPAVPASKKAVLSANGVLLTDGFATPDGHLINTCYSTNTPAVPGQSAANLVPNSTMTNKTIGDEMIANGTTWAWYSGGWTNALAGHADPTFQFHHQPFNYYLTFADATSPGGSAATAANKAKYLLDETAFTAACAAGTLPSVSFVKPLGIDNEHPGYTDIYTSELHADSLIKIMMASPEYSSMLIIVTYDEHGGQWDHVPPPAGDIWGPGSRVPCILIGPYVKQGYIDHTQYETLSILKLIENRFGLSALATRDAAAAPFTNAFVF